MFMARRSLSMVPEMVMVWVGNVLVCAKLGREGTRPTRMRPRFHSLAALGSYETQQNTTVRTPAGRIEVRI